MIERNDSFKRIKLNHSNALPRYIIALDCETRRTQQDPAGTKFAHKLRLGVAICSRLRGNVPCDIKLHRLYTKEDIWKLIVKHTALTHTTWIVAHNALFDFIVSGLPDMFEQGKLSIDWPRTKRIREDNNVDNPHAQGFCVIESPPTIIACKVGETQGRLVIVDSMNWFPQPLRELGKACGMPKHEMPEFEASEEEWFLYCEQDAKIVFKTFISLIDFVRENNFGMFRYTAPSQSMAAYRHRFMAHPLYTHNNERVTRIERQGYFGGRTEVFKLGATKCRVHQLDVNSLFPAIMSDGFFPSALNRFSLETEFSGKMPQIEWHNSIAEVELDTEIARFPFRRPKQVVYPVGKFTTTLCGEELLDAVSLGIVHRIRSWAEYTTKRLFGEFVSTLWSMRQEYKRSSNVLYEQFTKKMMNSLYGKFGQLSPQWINVNDNLSAVPWSRWRERNSVTGEKKEFRAFGWQVQQQVARTEITGSFVAISAFITAAARKRMNDLRDIAGDRNVYYQAIDSLIVNERGLSNLHESNQICPQTLGKLRHQLSADSLTVLGHNDYALGDKLVTSGLALNRSILEDETVLQRKFMTTEILFDAMPHDAVIEELLPWQRLSPYSHGKVGIEGWTIPYDADDFASIDSYDPWTASESAAAAADTCS